MTESSLEPSLASLPLQQPQGHTQKGQEPEPPTCDPTPTAATSMSTLTPAPAPLLDVQPKSGSEGGTSSGEAPESRTPSPGHRRGASDQRHVFAEIPSAADLYAPAGTRPTGSSISPSVASSDTGPSTANSQVIESKHRFERLPNGGHRHQLCAPKRHQFLSNQVRRLRELLEGIKDRDEHHHHHHHHGYHQNHHLKAEAMEHPLSLLNEKLADFEHGHANNSPSNHKKKHSVKEEFVHKYGDLHHVVGKGAFGTVRLAIKKNPETGLESVYAVKEFKLNHNESPKAYMRRLTSEFCIASSLRHVNVIQTMDLLQLHGETYSEVMEYCAGGDMHSLIASANTLGESESNCFFSQLLHGVAFLHSMGVVHRDLKPENLLLTADGCLKIADFGNSEVFRMPWEKKVRSSASIRGSGPFIAPEEFSTKTFDARKVDMWACGIIYLCMRIGRYTWHEASKGDPIWESFLYKRDHLLAMQTSNTSTNRDHHPSKAPAHIGLTALEQAAHLTLGWPDYILDVMEQILEVDPKKRWQAVQALKSEWLMNVDNCHPSDIPEKQTLDESDFDAVEPSQRVGSKVVQQDTDMTGCKIVKEAKGRKDTGTVAPPS